MTIDHLAKGMLRGYQNLKLRKWYVEQMLQDELPDDLRKAITTGYERTCAQISAVDQAIESSWTGVKRVLQLMTRGNYTMERASALVGIKECDMEKRYIEMTYNAVGINYLQELERRGLPVLKEELEQLYLSNIWDVRKQKTFEAQRKILQTVSRKTLEIPR